MTLEEVAAAFAGKVYDDTVIAPWPNGPSGKFRQIKIIVDPKSSGGFIAWPHTLGEGTVIEARRYARQKLEEAGLI